MPGKQKPVPQAFPALSSRGKGEMLSTEDAAKILNVSRPYAVKLADSGRLGVIEKTEGGQRRISAAAVETYRSEQHAKSRKALEELAATSQDTGLYDTTAKSTNENKKQT